MTVSINVTTPDNRKARVTRTDGFEQIVEPGLTAQFCVYAEAPSMTIEYVVVEPVSEEPEAPAASLDGGGNGKPPPGT